MKESIVKNVCFILELVIEIFEREVEMPEIATSVEKIRVDKKKLSLITSELFIEFLSQTLLLEYQ